MKHTTLIYSTEQDLDRLMSQADATQRGLLTFDKFVILMEEELRIQQVKGIHRRMGEWFKAFNLFVLKVWYIT